MPIPSCSEISGLNSDSCGDTATHNWCNPGEPCNVCYDTGAMESVCSAVTPSPTDSLDGCPNNLMCSTTGKESPVDIQIFVQVYIVTLVQQVQMIKDYRLTNIIKDVR